MTGDVVWLRSALSPETTGDRPPEPGDLRGPWAFAVREGDTLSITRDAMGLMPAYWGRLPDGSIAVSDRLVDLAARGCDITADAVYATAQALRCAGELPTRTSVLGIQRVPPGCTVTIPRAGEPRVTRWWRPEDAPATRRISLPRAAEELRHLLRVAVDDAVEAMDGPTAAHLSGGMDSTALAVLTQASLGARNRSLDLVTSWSPDVSLDPHHEGLSPEHLVRDERDVVRSVADGLGVPVLFATTGVGTDSWLSEAGVLQPQETLIWEAGLLPRMQERGVRHVVSGWGGDEFASFNGRAALRAQVRGLQVRALRQAYAAMRHRGLSPVRAAAEFAKAGAPHWLREHIPSVRRGTIEGPLREAERARAQQQPEVAEAILRSARRSRRVDSPRQMQAALYANGHLARRVESWHEAGARFGITYHYPLLDLRLVEWALSMPPEVWRTTGARMVFREAIRDIVREDVWNGDKQDPSVSVMVRERREAGLL